MTATPQTTDALASRTAPAVVSATAEIEKSERLWTVGLALLVVLQLWAGMISTSFWLDETGTWWIIKDGPAEVIRRAFSWSGQSPLFYLIEWASSRVLGPNEIALRIPSVLAMCGAIWFVFKIGERLYGRAAATTAAFVFLCAASFFAVDARPYAVTFFCLTSSSWALLRWLDSNRPRDAAIFVIAGTLTVYGHCLLSLGLAPGLIYGYAQLQRDRRRLVRLAIMAATIVAFCLPLVPELMRFYTTRSVHTFTARPSATELMVALIPCSFGGALVLLVRAFRGEAAREQNSLLLVGAWALFAPVFLWVIAVTTDVRLFVPRYYSSALPGQALLVGGLLASIRMPALRKALLVIIALTAVIAEGRMTMQSHGNENWRAAMDFIRTEANPSAPVLLVSGFAEARDFSSLRDPALSGILFAPELIYGEPANSIRLPNAFTSRDTPEMEAIVERIENQPRFYLVTENPDRSYENWLAGRLAAQCGSGPTQRSFGYIWVTRFLCRKR